MRIRWLTFCVALLPLVLSGCGHSGMEVAPVRGRVTLDDKPLPNVGVEFQPEGNKRPAYGGTDDQGEYQLFFKRGVMGAPIGQHTVRILLSPSDPRSSQFPNRYNQQSELRAEVESGADNVINFDLKSDPK